MRVSLLGSARLACAGSALVLLCGCFRGPARPAGRPQPAAEVRATLPRLGYSIQAGAFARVENAVRLAETLQGLGLNATFYASAPEGSEHRLYRVRFGDFPSRDAALVKGEALRADGVIQAFYIVAPEEPPLPRLSPGDEAGLRANLVETATNYVGIPYLWGGATEAGFDCSGLAMAVYRLNGLQLPRSSREQYARGEPVPLDRLRKGDLLFFATGGGTAVTHVGIYTGGESFIHAPKRGRRIGSDRLEGYYRQHLVGARSYLSGS